MEESNNSEKYIYESPDDGKTVYRREMGGVTRELLSSPSKPDDLFRYAEFVKIIDKIGRAHV